MNTQPGCKDPFVEVPGFEYRYVTASAAAEQGFTAAEQFRRYVERGTTWEYVGRDPLTQRYVMRRKKGARP